ncbi:prefoldin subunit 3 [Anabrus simplex]|uniref:prefoldin subunit 3 n=1 Tax=Anabrus simplex TaxID=316456 RepID=UPI0034DD6A56
MEGDRKDTGDPGDEKKVKSYAGIPEAAFVEDVDAFMALDENSGGADKVLKKLDEQHSKYKLMEFNLLSKRRRLKAQIPDLEHSLEMIKLLQKQRDSPDDIETQFLLSEQVFVKAAVPPTDMVCLWLGANVMLEYTLDDAMNLLAKNIDTAKTNLSCVEHDLDFLRDQFTTTEVNMARVFNWDVKRRQAAKTTS